MSETNELDRMIAEDRALACRTCLGHGFLGGCETTRYRDGSIASKKDVGRVCEACGGRGVRP